MGLTTDYQLGELELAVMAVVWQRDEVTVRDVWEALQPSRTLAYTTVMTVLARLVPKGAVTVTKRGKAAYYRAVGTPAEVDARLAQRAMHDVLERFGDAAITGFVRELEQVDPATLARLRAQLNAGEADGA